MLHSRQCLRAIYNMEYDANVRKNTEDKFLNTHFLTRNIKRLVSTIFFFFFFFWQIISLFKFKQMTEQNS